MAGQLRFRVCRVIIRKKQFLGGITIGAFGWKVVYLYVMYG